MYRSQITSLQTLCTISNTLVMTLCCLAGITGHGHAVEYGAADFTLSEEHPWVRRGAPGGRFTGAKPVTEWDEATGTNIIWRAPLRMFGNSSPLVVEDKVIVVSEPGIISCFAAETGKLLWERDEFDLIWPNLAKRSPAEKAELKQLIEDIIHARMQDGLFRLKDFRGKDKDYQFNAHYAAWRDQALKGQHPVIVARHDDASQLNWYPPKARQKIKDAMEYRDQKKLIDAGVILNHKKGRVYMQWTGMAFCPPLSDGKRIYVQLPGHNYVAYSLDGKRLWTRRANKGGIQKVMWRETPTGTLIDGKWVVASARMSKCYEVLDGATGKVVFQSKAKALTGRCRNQTFVRLRVDGKPFVIDSAGKLLGSDWQLGKKVASWKSFGNAKQFIADYGAIQAGDLLFTAWGGYGGKKEAGIRTYKISGTATNPSITEIDYLQLVNRDRQSPAVKKYYGKDKGKADINWRGLTVGDKHIYMCGAHHWVTIVNRDSGQVVNCVRYDETATDHTNQGIFAAGKVYLPTWSGMTAVFDDNNGKLITVNRTEPTITGSFAPHGDKLYLRGMFNLYCIGKK